MVYAICFFIALFIIGLAVYFGILIKGYCDFMKDARSMHCPYSSNPNKHRKRK